MMMFAPALARAMERGRPSVPEPPVMMIVRLWNEPGAARGFSGVSDMLRCLLAF
jgi:hypothetical protein